MKIWIVYGMTGEYSDRTEWWVDAWRSKDEAEQRVAQLDAAMRQYGANRDDLQYEERKAVEDKMRALDQHFQMDYTGTRYGAGEVELKP